MTLTTDDGQAEYDAFEFKIKDKNADVGQLRRWMNH